MIARVSLIYITVSKKLRRYLKCEIFSSQILRKRWRIIFNNNILSFLFERDDCTSIYMYMASGYIFRNDSPVHDLRHEFALLR